MTTVQWVYCSSFERRNNKDKWMLVDNIWTIPIVSYQFVSNFLLTAICSHLSFNTICLKWKTGLNHGLSACIFHTIIIYSQNLAFGLEKLLDNHKKGHETRMSTCLRQQIFQRLKSFPIQLQQSSLKITVLRKQFIETSSYSGL